VPQMNIEPADAAVGGMREPCLASTVSLTVFRSRFGVESPRLKAMATSASPAFDNKLHAGLYCVEASLLGLWKGLISFCKLFLNQLVTVTYIPEKCR
jgi:hypothetical protein